jgi:hypothetical protein
MSKITISVEFTPSKIPKISEEILFGIHGFSKKCFEIQMVAVVCSSNISVENPDIGLKEIPVNEATHLSFYLTNISEIPATLFFSASPDMDQLLGELARESMIFVIQPKEKKKVSLTYVPKVYQIYNFHFLLKFLDLMRPLLFKLFL